MRSKSTDAVDILLVDDREDGLIALEAILSGPRYNLVKARSGKEAYGLLPYHDFAMILLDVQMPEMDGFETAQMIRSEPAYASLPIVFVTAINKDDRYVYRGYESGAVDYIFKPFDPMILISKVAVFSDLHRQKRKIEEQAQMLMNQEALAYQSRMQAMELKSLQRYQTLADAIPHMVWEASSDGSLIYHNKQCELYTGLTFEQCKGAGWQQAIHEPDLKNFLVRWMNALQTRQKFEMEGRIRNAQGQYRWHLMKVTPEIDENGKVQAWIGTCTDIQDRKNTERELVDARKVAESANLAKTQFLANMSHEIRTPLNAIMGFTELMLEPGITASDRMNSLSIVRRNSQQLLKIIDEILDISKVEAGGLEIERVETDVINLISGLRSLLQVSAAKKKIKLEFDVEGRAPDRIITDSTRLRQILMNLIGNAIKFTHAGSVRTVVRMVRKANGKDYLQFAVTDTGVGVNESFSEKIFLPFLQADSSTTRIYGGTGLGLALSRKLARALGGDLWLESSEVGKGSTFVAEIEMEIADHAGWVSHFTDFDLSDEKDLKTDHSGSLRGARILLAEDAEENQLLISHFLSNLGAVIDVANNGQEAIEKALSNDYAAVLMDIQMPLIDGYEATSRLRQAGFRKPIIALTAHALPEEREKSLRTGCNAHLTKPLDRQQLVDSLVEHVHHTH